MRELKRSDRQYVEVEEFAEYEFTSCIAYEMAIRNSKVIDLMNNIFRNEHKRSNDEINDEVQSCSDKLFLEYGIVDEIWTKYHFFDELNKIFNDNYKKRINDGDNTSSIRTQEHDGYCRYVDIEKDGRTSSYRRHSIYPNFKRPRMYMYSFETFADVHIDFSIPENELIAYIKHLKKDYDKGIIQSSYEEILGLMPKAENGVKRKAETMADIFYIYDANKQGVTKQDIRYELYGYYRDDKGIKTKTFDYKTLKKYIEFAEDYIENKKYIELITGKSYKNIQNKLGIS